MATGWTRPFVVNDLTMPPMSDIVSRLCEPLAEGQPPLIRDLLDKSAFTTQRGDRRLHARRA